MLSLQTEQICCSVAYQVHPIQLLLWLGEVRQTVNNLVLHANLMALSFTEPELWAIEVYIAGIGMPDVFGSCDLDLDPMTSCIPRRQLGLMGFCLYVLTIQDIENSWLSQRI